MNLTIQKNGWLKPVDIVPSPNFSQRPDTPISLIVLHNISLPPFEYGSGDICRFFQNQLDPNVHPFFSTIANMRVSAHFLIERTGRLKQFVSCLDMAHHAGISNFCGREKCNEFSIGIEIEGCDTEVFDERQYATLIPLLYTLQASYPIKAVTGHSDIAPGRKTDPGPFFDWNRLTDFPVIRLNKY